MHIGEEALVAADQGPGQEGLRQGQLRGRVHRGSVVEAGRAGWVLRPAGDDTDESGQSKGRES